MKIRQALAGDLQAVASLTAAAYAPYTALFGAPPIPVTEDYSPRIERGEIWLLEEDATSPQGQPVRKVTVFNKGTTRGSTPQVTAHRLYDDKGNLQPRIAEKVPSLSDGDWKVAADGSMDVTWKVRPDVFWQDGTPLTATWIAPPLGAAFGIGLPLQYVVMAIVRAVRESA